MQQHPTAIKTGDTPSMFQRLFGRQRRRDNLIVCDSLYASIVAAARQPVLYSRIEAPDTPLGRFEMLALHMVLLQHRMHDVSPAMRELAQELIDVFFTDIDHSLRELGIGDMGVPKRMKKLARMYYGRTAAYADALVRADRPALAEALARNVRPDAPAGWPQATELAAYAMAAHDALSVQLDDDILAGRVVFPAAPAEAS